MNEGHGIDHGMIKYLLKSRERLGQNKERNDAPKRATIVGQQSGTHWPTSYDGCCTGRLYRGVMCKMVLHR